MRYLQWRAETAMIPQPEDDIDEEEAEEEYRFDFKLNSRFLLRLDTILDYTNLSLYDFEEEIQLGWDDEAHWHPHCLRWRELIPLCDYISQQNPEVPYPGWILLLLFRFAPICSDEDAEIAYPALKESWESLGLFSQDDIQRLIETADFRKGRFVWSQDEQGNWLVDQAEDDWKKTGFMLYSLRHIENPDFPWEQWSSLCRQCRIEDYAFKPGEFYFAEHYQYDLTFPMNTSTNETLSEFISGISQEMRDLRLGTVSGYGMHLDAHGHEISRDYSIYVRDDKGVFITILKNALNEYTDVSVEDLWVQRPERRKITLKELLSE